MPKSEGHTKNPHKVVNLESNFLIRPLTCSALFGCLVAFESIAMHKIQLPILLNFSLIRLSTCVPLAMLASALSVTAGQCWAGRLLRAVFSRHMKINIKVCHPVSAVNPFL